MNKEQVEELRQLEIQAFDTYKRLSILRDSIKEEGKVTVLDDTVQRAYNLYHEVQHEYFYWM